MERDQDSGSESDRDDRDDDSDSEEDSEEEREGGDNERQDDDKKREENKDRGKKKETKMLISIPECIFFNIMSCVFFSGSYSRQVGVCVLQTCQRKEMGRKRRKEL